MPPKRSTAQKFELVPKANAREVLKLLALPPDTRARVSQVGDEVLIQIRLPRRNSCFPFRGDDCRGDTFFDRIEAASVPKLRLSKRGGARKPSR